MGRKPLDGESGTCVVSVRMTVAERDRLTVAAAKFGKPRAEFVRLVLLAAANGATGATPERTVLTPGERRAARAEGARSAARVEAIVGSSHEHVAGPQLSGGIHRCTEKSCDARKVGGRWMEVG